MSMTHLEWLVDSVKCCNWWCILNCCILCH